MAASKENKLPPSFSGFDSHKFLHESIFGCSKRSPDFKTAVYSMLPSIRTVPVSGHLKQNSILRRPFQLSVNEVFRMKAEHFGFKMKVLASWKFAKQSQRTPFPVQVNKHFTANIYAVYCAVKILKEVRFSESLLILLEIRFVWNNGAQKHSLSIDVRCPVSGQFFLCCTESMN